MKRNFYCLFLSVLLSISTNFSYGQNQLYKLIEAKQSLPTTNVDVFRTTTLQNVTLRSQNVDHEILFLDILKSNQLLSNNPESISIPIKYDGRNLELTLIRNKILAPGYNVKTSSNRPFFQTTTSHYYHGIIDGVDNSIVAMSFVNNELVGIIDAPGLGNLVLGALEDQKDKYILYNINQVTERPEFECGSDLLEEINSIKEEGNSSYRMNNCVNVYLECEHDFFLEEGSVQNTVNQVTAIFNVVSTMYANENITTKISEIKVWDTPDTYSTSSTSNALNSFRNQNPSFNGDLAHLISRGAPSGGGVAWVNAICSSYGYAYSYVYNYYNELPSYSWTVNVITHEMGHNLGSPHTHNCSWNGNNTAIDGCGPTAGYSEGSCPTAPLPTNGGTVMSYCHLISGVGINPSNGFGIQPGNLIRSRVSNASCLSTCEDCVDVGLACDDGDPCTTNDVLDSNCNCAGTLGPDSDDDGICDILDQCPGFDDNLIGTACDDGDICTINDTVGSNCNCEGTFQDSDNDGVCDGLDECEGSDDNLDSDNDGIPDGCDFDCIDMIGNFPNNPLNHSGSGTSTTTINFSQLSVNVNFSISNIGSKLNGSPSSRFNENITINYVNEFSNNVTYGSFSGSNTSSVNVNIPGKVSAVTIILSDAYDGNSPNISVSLSQVNYCQEENSCVAPDSDNDGICDQNDICPGFDDNLDSDGDGIPDGCDNCNTTTSNFNPNPLTHQGSGSSSSNIDFGTGANDISFNIRGINSKTNGKSDRRFIDQVTVNYIDLNGNSQTYGVFSGTNSSQISVNIQGARLINLILSDIYDGNSESATLEIDMSSVQYCNISNSGSPTITNGILNTSNTLKTWPNPASYHVSISYSNTYSESNNVNLQIMDIRGKLVFRENIDFATKNIEFNVNTAELKNGIFLLLLKDGDTYLSDKIVILH
jgi:hypothetical protein